ncbi:MAG TPA: hypothetical protein VGB94_07870 [Acidobacteriaceae bacterium]
MSQRDVRLRHNSAETMIHIDPLTSASDEIQRYPPCIIISYVLCFIYAIHSEQPLLLQRRHPPTLLSTLD